MICYYSVPRVYDADEEVDQNWDMNLLQGRGILGKSLIILACMNDNCPIAGQTIYLKFWSYKVQNAFQKKNTINTKNKKFMGLTSEHWPPIIVQRACLPDQTWGTIRHPLAKDLTKDNLTIKNTTDQNLQYNSSRNQNC